MSRVNDVLEGPGDGQGVWVITGERGSGKTAVWEWAVQRARALRIRVLVLRPDAVESELPFGGLVDLLQGLGSALEALSGAQRDVVDRLLLRGEVSVDAATVERDLGVAVLAAVGGAATAGRVLVAVDDWQRLDAPSQRVLLWALKRLDQAPVGLLATATPDSEDLLPSRLGDLRFERFVLVPVSTDAVGMLIRERLGAGVDGVTRQRIAQVAGGNVGVALVLGSAVLRHGRGEVWPADRPLPIPGGVRGLVAGDLVGLEQPERRAIEAAFALGPVPEDALRRSLDRLGWPVIDTDKLRDRGLLSVKDGIEHCHPLIGAVLYAECPSADRRSLHAALADESGDADDRAWHAALAANGPDGVVADALERAADAARRRGDAIRAATRSDMASRMTPAGDQERRDERVLAQALDRYRLGDAEQARAQWRNLAASSRSVSVAVTSLAHLAMFHEGLTVHENEEILRRAVERGEGNPVVRARIQTTRAVIASWGARPRVAQELAEDAVRLVRGSGAGSTEGEALAALVEASFLLGGGVRRDLLDRAIELERNGPETPVEARPSLLGALLEVWMSDRLDLAEQGLRGALDVALRTGDEASPALVLVGLTEVACWQGGLERASDYARQAAIYQQRGSAWHLQGMVRYAAALVHIAAGEIHPGRAEAQAALAFDEPRGVLLQYGRSSAALGQLDLSLGDASGALEWLEPLHAAVQSGGYGEPALFRYLPDLIEARANVGDLKGARVALEPFETNAAQTARPWLTATAARCRGMLLIAEGKAADAAAQLHGACALHEALGQPGEHARCLLALGSAYRRLRRKRDADRTLAASEQQFAQIGMRLWAELAGAERRRTNLRPRAESDLTATERQIAQLASAGLSNREIASRVYLSLKTVEATLTRIYRKLGVRSRTALAHHLATQGGGHP